MSLNWSLGITTAPRQINTLHRTLQSVVAAGWDGMYDRVRIFAEPGTAMPLQSPIAATWTSHAERLGPYGNLRAAVARLLEADSHRKAEVLLILQDDIQLTAGLRSFLDADENFQTLIESTDTGVVSLYCAAPNHHEDRAAMFYAGKAGKSGWHEIEKLPRRAYGALAYAFSRRSAERFVAAKTGNGKALAADYWVGRWCREHDLEYWTHSPSFVRHADQGCSSLGEPNLNEECRQCREFVESLPVSGPARARERPGNQQPPAEAA